MDSEREKFRTYVEKSGVMSALTNALVHLYEEPEKPNDALTYLKLTLGTMNHEEKHVQMLEEKIKEQKATIDNLNAENAFLKERLAQAEAAAAFKATTGQAETKDNVTKHPPEDV
ncbi:c-Myc-binding protein-like [Homarus americanus]|uniref:c-Myc-binding protein-like n=1 Tax=Homarus americanus TaxID=6706 RepID=A0A8J5MRK0_HOMAM|nr:c-Myc-binding protein-like [Homarus americanus]XP_042236361.1 c-Myc-binding protein-like [Homarus americanus]XP_042236362.1 c-Myc-binding protein-like [Homarus americanus]KAG7160984.1 c-Myc-binding protein-like [Homarus americanus]